jgi:hypothetical protein
MQANPKVIREAGWIKIEQADAETLLQRAAERFRGTAGSAYDEGYTEGVMKTLAWLLGRTTVRPDVGWLPQVKTAGSGAGAS